MSDAVTIKTILEHKDLINVRNPRFEIGATDHQVGDMVLAKIYKTFDRSYITTPPGWSILQGTAAYNIYRKNWSNKEPHTFVFEEQEIIEDWISKAARHGDVEDDLSLEDALRMAEVFLEHHDIMSEVKIHKDGYGYFTVYPNPAHWEALD